jgi:transglutaminase-like putative cysteine protease
LNRYHITHVTRYEYEGQVVHAHHTAYLRPRDFEGQELIKSAIDWEPEPVTVTTSFDYFGNTCDEIELLSPHDLLEVRATSVVEVSRPVFERTLAPSLSWEQAARLLRQDKQLLREREFCYDSPHVRINPQLASYAAASFVTDRPLVEAVLDLTRRIHTEFTYDPLVTDVSTPLARVLKHKRGVCQDFAHLAIGCLRSLGLAARYVSGYLETRPPPGRPRLVGADASHAWASVYVPELGWLDIDPTNDVVPGDRHVTLAWGRDFSDASPLRGVVLGGGAQRLRVSVDVEAEPKSETAASAPGASPAPELRSP